MAYVKWQKSRKSKSVGGKPIFTWEDDSLVTLEEINKVLLVVLEGEEPAITTRAFRPALPCWQDRVLQNTVNENCNSDGLYAV